MRSLFIAIGNPLRRDDGVAQAALARLKGVESRVVHQLTPEMADDIAAYDVVVFIDADASASEVRIERLDSLCDGGPSITHVMGPASVVGLSMSIFGFTGQAYLCRIPVNDLSAGEGLSEQAVLNAERAANKLWLVKA